MTSVTKFLYNYQRSKNEKLLHLDIYFFSLHLIFLNVTVVSGNSPATCSPSEAKGNNGSQ